MSNEQSQVVVGFDFSDSAWAALRRGVALASRAPFHVLHFACILDPHAGVPALPPEKHVDIVYADRVRDELARCVEQALREAATIGRVHFHVHVRLAKSAAHELLEIAQEVGADLIVVGCAGRRGIERVLLGSVSEHVVREAGCAVVIARPKEYAYVVHEDVVEVEPQHHGSFAFTYDDHLGAIEPLGWPT